jgi:hypothetical protein
MSVAVSLSPTAWLFYHIFFPLSTPFFKKIKKNIAVVKNATATPVFLLLIGYFAQLVTGFHTVLVTFDHLFNHLAAYATCLLCSKIAVVTLLEVNAYFICSFHLETVKTFLSFGNKILVGHNIFSF